HVVSDDIAGHAEDGAVAQRNSAREAGQDVEGDREQAEDKDFGDQCWRIDVENERHEQHERGHQAEQYKARQALCHDPARPKSPCGRNASSIAMGPKIMKFASSGTQICPKLARKPTSRLPTAAPTRLPWPPIMTMASAKTRI